MNFFATIRQRCFAALAGVALLLAGHGASAQSLSLTSTAFADNGTIPNEYTYRLGSQCSGSNWSPPLIFGGVPLATQSFALVVRDPDGGNWLHWKAWNIPSTTRTLAGNAAASATFPMANNDFGTAGYGGPCPPTPNHRYVFTLYALNTTFNAEPSESALAAAALATATLTGKRSPTDNLPAASGSSYNGIWSASDGAYLVLMKDVSGSTALALEVAPTLASLKVWLGSGTTSGINLANIANGADTLAATIAGTTLTGTKTVAGRAANYSATLTFAYVGSGYDGIWQRSDAGNSYIAYSTVNIGGTTTAIAIPVTINGDGTIAHEVYAGAALGDTYTGVSLADPNRTLRLAFVGATATGTATVLGVPPVRTTFSATQIIRIAP